MEEVERAILRFNAERDWGQFHSPVNLAKSIAIEAAELLECFQWDEENYNKSAVCDELADVVIYAISMADKLDVQLEDIMMEKLKKNEKKYPIKKSKGNSKKYTDF